MSSPTPLSSTSGLTLQVRLDSSREEIEKLVLSQLDIVLNKPSTSPKHVYPTAPVRIQRVSDMMKADLDLAYDAETRTLRVSPCGPHIGPLLYMPRLPISFDDCALRQQYDGGKGTLPPFADYILNAARACAIIKHHTERGSSRDIRSFVALGMNIIVKGPSNPRRIAGVAV